MKRDFFGFLYIVLLGFVALSSFMGIVSIMDYFHCPNWLRYTLVLPAITVCYYVTDAVNKKFIEDFLKDKNDN